MTRIHRSLATLAVTVLVAACSVGATASPRASTLPVSAAPSQGVVSCPTSPPAPLPAGEERVVTIETAKGAIEITVEANLGPRAAGNFVALAGCGFYDGTIFHRVVPGFVIQGGDPTGTGSGGPGYEFQDDPVDAAYTRGTVAMANAGPNTNGSQFFIVLADSELDPLYSVFGHVTTGMEAVDAIAVGAGAPPANPIVMDKVTVKTP
jgi:cyclophilin family peptidyl-prolyl cis-trans isomerase